MTLFVYVCFILSAFPCFQSLSLAIVVFFFGSIVLKSVLQTFITYFRGSNPMKQDEVPLQGACSLRSFSRSYSIKYVPELAFI